MAVIEPTTIETIIEYEMIRTPDYALIADLVNRAKGPERSMAQFAEDSGIGASTLSRIVNMLIKKPLSVDILIKIFESRADETDEYLLDSLARANGMYPKEYAERTKKRNDFAARRNEEMSRARMMKNALIAGVAACGLPLAQVANSPRPCPMEIPTLYPRKYGDFLLDIKSASNTSPITDWAFYLYPHLLEQSDVERRRSPKSMVQDIIERISVWFMLDAWNPDEVRGMKVSFVFVDEELFYEFVDALQGARLNNEMSAILMDPQSYAILKEVWIPGEYPRLANISIFEVPAPCEKMPEADESFSDTNEETENDE